MHGDSLFSNDASLCVGPYVFVSRALYLTCIYVTYKLLAVTSDLNFTITRYYSP